MKKIFKAVYALFLFKPYTTLPRFFEIGYGVIAWLCVGLIIYAFLIK
jgi:hypothetical protein